MTFVNILSCCLGLGLGSTASALASVSKATASVSNPSASASVSGILPWSQHWTSVVLQNFFLYSDYEYRVKHIKSIINNEDTEGSSAPYEVHKFVDDTTLSELIPPSHTRTDMANYLTSLLTWTARTTCNSIHPKLKRCFLVASTQLIPPPSSCRPSWCKLNVDRPRQYYSVKSKQETISLNNLKQQQSHHQGRVKMRRDRQIFWLTMKTVLL